jgi:uncharacterized protein with PQ loop repeat
MGSDVVIAIYLPISLFATILILFLSNPKVFRIYFVETKDKGRIGPTGFLIMVFGFFFQLSSIIWQVSI